MTTEESGGGALIRFVGEPNAPDRPGELTRWRRFIRFFWPWAQEGGKLVGRAHELADAYAAAEVAKRSSEAEKFAAEAAEIASRRDLNRQEAVKVVNQEIARIFSADGVPDAAKKLQLANLLAANPQIAAQLELIEQMYSRLHLAHGVQVEMSITVDAKAGAVPDET